MFIAFRGNYFTLFLFFIFKTKKLVVSTFYNMIKQKPSNERIYIVFQNSNVKSVHRVFAVNGKIDFFYFFLNWNRKLCLGLYYLLMLLCWFLGISFITLPLQIVSCFIGSRSACLRSTQCRKRVGSVIMVRIKVHRV